MLQEKFVKELDDAKSELKDLKAELDQRLSEKVNHLRAVSLFGQRKCTLIEFIF